MRLIGFLLVLSFYSASLYAIPKDLKQYLKSRWKLSYTEEKYLDQGKILTDANVTDQQGLQSFDMQATAWHQKKCRKVIRKLSQFELYPEWISFIKKLRYNDQTKLMTMHADHPLLPFPMIVNIVVERPKKPGHYKFRFPTGIFKGLTGYFDIAQYNNRCHLYVESHWTGKKSKIPNLVIELFSETLARIGGEILMRQSR
ncbi:MAG: hypothetical protein CME65_05145 [Halobacteriovoraceae bacterium]|nr:hypothetical protein [Halobacteriovoraceae bacterium]|tara:strand:- start:14151 stop:14750 length:600 start_codon:yes stop_codon:yes gene_type:complete